MILSDRVRFRAAERADLPKFVEWLNDPDVRRCLLMHLPMSMAEEEQWYEKMVARPVAEHVLVIEAQVDGDWETIGTTAFHAFDWRCRKAEFGIMIGAKQHWDRGFGTAAVQLMLRHGFETLNLNRVELRVFEINPRAIRVYEKAGFVHEGRLRQALFLEGRYVDELVMSVLREEWEAPSTPLA